MATQRTLALKAGQQQELEDYREACRCLRDDAEASLNHLHLAQRHQQYVRPSNLAERAFVEERRRTKVIPHLQTEPSLVNLVFAVLIRVSDRWNKKSFSAFEQHQIRTFRQRLKLDEPGVSDLETKPEAQPRRSAASTPSGLQELRDLTRAGPFVRPGTSGSSRCGPLRRRRGAAGRAGAQPL